MKAFINIICLVTVPFAPQLAIADHDNSDYENVHDALNKKFPISVKMASSIQAKIAKQNLADMNRIKEAIKVGDDFMQQYLDGFACYLSPDWDLQISKLVEDTEQIEHICSQIKVPKLSDSNRTYSVRRELCSQAYLNDFNFENGGVSLTYQMIKLGTTTYLPPGALHTFNSEDSGKTEQITVSISSHNKVSNFVPEDGKEERMHTITLSEVKSYDGLLPDGSPAKLSENEKDRVNRYKTIANQIEQLAKQVCK